MFPLTGTFNNAKIDAKLNVFVFCGVLSVYFTAAQYIDFYYLEI